MKQDRNPRPEKALAVEKLAEKLSTAKSVFLTDYSGLSVAEISQLRREFRKNGAEYLVVKNTLARLSAKSTGHDGILPFLEGPTALAFSYDDPASPARAVVKFLQDRGKKASQKPEIKACMIEGDVLPGKDASAIANWPTRDELLAKLVGSLNSPISGLVMTLAGVQKKLLYALNAVAEKKSEN